MKKMIEHHFVWNNKLIKVCLNSNQYFRQSHVVMSKEEKDFLKLIYKNKNKYSINTEMKYLL